MDSSNGCAAAGVDSSAAINAFICSQLFRAPGQILLSCRLQMSHLLRLPDLQHRHAGDDGVGVLLGGGVHRVVGTDHKNQIRLC